MIERDCGCPMYANSSAAVARARKLSGSNEATTTLVGSGRESRPSRHNTIKLVLLALLPQIPTYLLSRSHYHFCDRTPRTPDSSAGVRCYIPAARFWPPSSFICWPIDSTHCACANTLSKTCPSRPAQPSRKAAPTTGPTPQPPPPPPPAAAATATATESATATAG